MKFGSYPTGDTVGSILAHSLKVNGLHFRKGRKLSAEDAADLLAAGVEEVTVAVLEKDDLGENEAAEVLAKSLVPKPAADNLRISAPFTGRVNVYAEKSGVFCVNAEAIDKFNAVTPSLTVSTLPDMTRVAARSLVATVKIIPYGVSRNDVDNAMGSAALSVKPFSVSNASLILTKTKGMNERLLDKGRDAVEQRLQAFDCDLTEVTTVNHEPDEIAKAIMEANGEIVLILTASATSDINDVGPMALQQSGGKITRFGMPVDPGNLLFLGKYNQRPVIGLPGCARSPALNGADWVLERIICGLEVTNEDIAGMGVGGLLKEIPTRPQPRAVAREISARPRVEILLLAAGGSRRMRGRDKLIEQVDGEALLRRSAKAALSAHVEKVHVVLQPDNDARENAIADLDVHRVYAPEWHEGMAASIRSGLAGISRGCDAVIVALADMPEVSAEHFNKLVAAYSPNDGREICRATTEDGKPGLPVLFGRRFFETIADLHGDRGARDVVKDATDFVVDVETHGQGAVIDLDTPEQWEAWKRAQQ